jgi:hypothetical protein
MGGHALSKTGEPPGTVINLKKRKLPVQEKPGFANRPVRGGLTGCESPVMWGGRNGSMIESAFFVALGSFL